MKGCFRDGETRHREIKHKRITCHVKGQLELARARFFPCVCSIPWRVLCSELPRAQTLLPLHRGVLAGLGPSGHLGVPAAQLSPSAQCCGAGAPCPVLGPAHVLLCKDAHPPSLGARAPSLGPFLTQTKQVTELTRLLAFPSMTLSFLSAQTLGVCSIQPARLLPWLTEDAAGSWCCARGKALNAQWSGWGRLGAAARALKAATRKASASFLYLCVRFWNSEELLTVVAGAPVPQAVAARLFCRLSCLWIGVQEPHTVFVPSAVRPRLRVSK